MLGTDFILRSLVADGIDHAFMVPGGLIDPFLPALGRVPEITPIVALCGFYGLIGMVNVCFDVPLPGPAKAS